MSLSLPTPRWTQRTETDRSCSPASLISGGASSPQGLVEEVSERIEEGSEKDPLAADLALIAAAQRVEHYEIAAYGTVRGLARQIGEFQCARLLAHTRGEEESADFLLTAIADPLIQQAALEDAGAEVNLENISHHDGSPETGERRSVSRKKKATRTERGAA